MASNVTFSNYLKNARFKFLADNASNQVPGTSTESTNRDHSKTFGDDNSMQDPCTPILVKNEICERVDFFKVGDESDDLSDLVIVNPASQRPNGTKYDDCFSAFWLGKDSGLISRKLLKKVENWQVKNLVSLPIIFDLGKTEPVALILWFEPTIKLNLADIWPTVMTTLFTNEQVAKNFSAVDLFITDWDPTKADVRFPDALQTDGAHLKSPWFDFETLKK